MDNLLSATNTWTERRRRSQRLSMHQPTIPGLHDLVAAHGPLGAVKAAEEAVSRRGAVRRFGVPAATEALAGRSGRTIAEVAAKAAVREIEAGQTPGYTYSAWCLTGLPHREHPPGKTWVIQTDLAQLEVRRGTRTDDDGITTELAVPYGTIGRLLLIDWQSEAIERGSRDIWLGSNPGALLLRLGLSRGGPVTRKVVEQVERLATCAISFRFGSAREGVVVNERLIEAYSYVGEEDPRTRRTTRMIREVRLSQAFYEELRRYPVTLCAEGSARYDRRGLWRGPPAPRLHGSPDETVDWFRRPHPAAPLRGRAPLKQVCGTGEEA